MDRSKFGEGVLIDIQTHRITLALAEEGQVPLQEVYQIIKKAGYEAGYDPVTVHLRVSGTLRRDGEKLLLTSSEGGLLFSLLGAGLGRLRDGQRADIQGHVDAETIPLLQEGELVDIVVDQHHD